MKYKLIQEYPGSPWLGTVINSITGIYVIKDVEIPTPKNYPKYWKKVDEFDFEILEVIMSLVTYKRINCNMFQAKNYNCYSEQDIINKGIITKVRRLSDDKIFSKNDKIYWDWIDANGENYCTLEAFYIGNNKLMFNTVEETWANGFRCFDRIEHYEEPVITTFDNVKLFKGDSYFNVFTEDIQTTADIGKNSLEIKSYVVNGPFTVKALNDNNTWTNRCKYFSTKIAAENWVKENKPEILFTTEDGVDIIAKDIIVYQLWTEKSKYKEFHGCIRNFTTNLNTNYVPQQKINKEVHGILYFSTKEKAQEYIDNNILKYSKTDMLTLGMLAELMNFLL